MQFICGREVSAIRLDGQRAAVELAPRVGEPVRSREVDVIGADAIVVAAGDGSLPLLERLGLRLPLYPLRLHNLVAPIAHEEFAPHIAIVDAVKRITISRINHRLRIAGGAVLQSTGQIDKPLGEALTKEALALLGQATHDWVPGAARISAALPWEGVKLLSPDGLPVIGNALHPRLFSMSGMGPPAGGSHVAPASWSPTWFPASGRSARGYAGCSSGRPILRFPIKSAAGRARRAFALP